MTKLDDNKPTKKKRPFKFKSAVKNVGHGVTDHMEDVLKKHIDDLVSGDADYIKECASPGHGRFYELFKVVSPLAFYWDVRELTGDIYFVHGNTLIKAALDHGNCYGYVGVAKLNNPNKPTRWDGIKVKLFASRNPAFRYQA